MALTGKFNEKSNFAFSPPCSKVEELSISINFAVLH
jgi:hypothetical protein